MEAVEGAIIDLVQWPAKPGETMSGRKLTVDAELEKPQRETFGYFLHETNPANGLVIGKTAPDWPSGTAATGLKLACYPVGVERGFMWKTGTCGDARAAWRLAMAVPTER
jgi:hypothetical protein